MGFAILISRLESWRWTFLLIGKLLFSWGFFCLLWLKISFVGGEILFGGRRFDAEEGVWDAGDLLHLCSGAVFGGSLEHDSGPSYRFHPRPHHCHRHHLPPQSVPAVRNSGLLATRPGLFIEIYLWYRLKLGLNILEVCFPWGWGRGTICPCY